MENGKAIQYINDNGIRRLEKCKDRTLGYDFEFHNDRIEDNITILFVDIKSKVKYIIDLSKKYIIENREYLINLFEDVFKNNTIYEASEKETLETTYLDQYEIKGSGSPNKLEYILKYADLKVNHIRDNNYWYGAFRYVSNMFSSSKPNEIEKFKHNYTYLENSIDIIKGKVKDLKLIGYLGSNGEFFHNINKEDNHNQYCINNLQCFIYYFNTINTVKKWVHSPHLKLIYCKWYGKDLPNTVFFRNSWKTFSQDFYNAKYNPSYYIIEFDKIKNMKIKKHLLQYGNLSITNNDKYHPDFNMQFLAMIEKLDLDITEFHNIHNLIQN